MPVLNYWTKVSVERTLADIQKILVKHGAKRVITDFEAGEPVGVTFSVDYNGMVMFFSLPCRVDGVLKACKKMGDSCSLKQAKMIGWRTLKDWVEAQLSIVQQEMAELPEVFLPYANTRGGETVYQYIKKLDSSSTPLMLGDA
jgi:uncharacterized protein with NAD-binding domain and iron-sulfur cluster